MKKLLAIVMVVAMMFSMSIIANADATADIVYADGVATITVYDAEISTVDFGVVYPEGVTCTKATWAAGWKDATATPIEDGDYTVSGIGNKAAADAAGNTYAVYTAACMQADGSPIAYDGDLLTFVFECPEGTEFKVVSATAANGADVTATTFATLVAEAAPVVTDTPEPVVTDTPEPEETKAPIEETKAPVEETKAPVEETKAPAETDEDDKATDAPAKATDKPAESGKKPAPQTADVAPVATMITLVVVAGLAIVALKKKATN